MSRKEDQNNLSKIPCGICKKPSGGITRTKEVCNRCFSVLQRDNKNKHQNDIEIPTFNLKDVNPEYLKSLS